MFNFYIITPVFNAVETIDSTIWSIVSQQGDIHIHYHVQDAGSTDGTLQKLEMWQSRLRFQEYLPATISFSFASVPDAGLYDGIAKGVTHLNIPEDAFMCWLNADDVLWQGAVAAIAEVARDVPELNWLTGQPSIIDPWGRVRSNRGSPLPTQIVAEGLAGPPYSNSVQQESTVWRKSLYTLAGGVNSSLKLAGDWDLWRRFAQFSDLMNFNRNIGAFRYRQGQLSSDMTLYVAEMNSIIPLHVREKIFRDIALGQNFLHISTIDMDKEGKWRLAKDVIKAKSWPFNFPEEECIRGAMETRLENVAQNLHRVESYLPGLNSRIAILESRIESIESRTDTIEKCSSHSFLSRCAKYKNILAAFIKQTAKKKLQSISESKQYLTHYNLPADNRPRVGIDCLQLCAGVSGGVESYMEMLVSCLIQDGSYAVILICTEDQYTAYKQHFGNSVGYRVHSISRIVRLASKISTMLRGKPLHLHAYYTKTFANLKEVSSISILHSPVQTFTLDDFSIPSVLNLHDLQHLHLPGNFSQSDIDARNLLYPRAAAKASKVIATSRFVADDIVQHGYAPREKLAVIPATWNPEVPAGLATFDAHEARKQYNLPQTYAFYPAQFWPHKNHARLAEALAIVRKAMPETDLHLVLTGNRAFPGWAATETVIHKESLDNVIHCLDRVPTGHLAGLYSAALFCVVPSTFEASSYPVIEAQLIGCPAMCSNVTSLPELMADGAGLLFDPWDVESIANSMTYWLKHPDEAQKSALLAYDKVRRDHSAEAYISGIISLYNELR